MKLNLENKFVVFELDSSIVDPSGFLIVYQVQNNLLVPKYDPREKYPLDNDTIVHYLLENEISLVYSLENTIQMPKSILGLKLSFENEVEFGSYIPLSKHYWFDFFKMYKIELKLFNFKDLKK